MKRQNPHRVGIEIALNTLLLWISQSRPARPSAHPAKETNKQT
jgi:hypothetical protein